jgi:hypothetical protein
VCDLIAAIDDATGKILAAEFFIGETSLHSMKVIMDVCSNHGIPEAFYMDEAAIFGKRDRDWNSQISRALETLNCNLILASSAQAKGRVERLFRTLQDRLIAELSNENIKSIPSANKFLNDKFIPLFNQKFSHPAREKEKSYLRIDPILNLKNILCRKEQRKINPGNSFSYKNVKFVIQGVKDYRFRTISINDHIDGTTSYDIMGTIVSVLPMEKSRDVA